MNVAVLGMGRLGASVAILLEHAGVTVRRWRRGEPLPEAADVWWITTGDGSVPEVAARLPADALVLHAAGAAGPELVGERAERGVLHPLMTFPGPAHGIPDLRGCGARVDGTPRALAAAEDLARILGMRPVHLSGDPTRYHAAACLASGHLGALFLDAVAVLTEAGVPAEEAPALLLPLAHESLRRAAEGGASALTGPAVRNDTATEARHRAALDPARAEVYRLLADRIRAHRAGGSR